MSYYTLLERDNAQEDWAIAWGDFDKDAVIDEAQDYCDSGYRRSNLKIIKTATEDYTVITAEVAQLNLGRYVTQANKEEYARVTDKLAFCSDLTGRSIDNPLTQQLEDLLDTEGEI